MRRILVTAISGNVANGILKALEETGDELYGCDINDYPVGMDRVKVFWKSDMAVAPYYIDNLLMKCNTYEITHLIPVNEVEIEVISNNIPRFIDEGIKVLINPPDIINTFLDKFKTYQFLKDITGISVPRTYEFNDFIEDGRQYIVKLRKACGSKFLKVFSDPKELEMLDLSKEDYIVQEYIDTPAEEYTVGVFSDMQKVSTIIFKRKLEHGYTSFVELIQDDTIDRDAKIIAQKINLRGAINIQLRKYKGLNYIFEINPRISGTVYFRHMLKYTDVLWWLDILDGKDYCYSAQYKRALGIRELHEKFLILEN